MHDPKFRHRAVAHPFESVRLHLWVVQVVVTHDWPKMGRFMCKTGNFAIIVGQWLSSSSTGFILVFARSIFFWIQQITRRCEEVKNDCGKNFREFATDKVLSGGWGTSHRILRWKKCQQPQTFLMGASCKKVASQKDSIVIGTQEIQIASSASETGNLLVRAEKFGDFDNHSSIESRPCSSQSMDSNSPFKQNFTGDDNFFRVFSIRPKYWKSFAMTGKICEDLSWNRPVSTHHRVQCD